MDRRNYPLYRQGGGMAHDERTIRNVDDEIYRIAPKTYDRGAVGRNARDEYGRDLREKRYLHHQMNRMANGGMPMMPPPPMGGPPMGGPPPMMPPPMEGPPMGGPPPLEGIEAAFAQQMSQNVDGAGNTEELIDAIRGNAKPIQARYDELSQYVGQQDAHQTPETVLALVQPTFLMTEQGIVDSGIEQLLQQIPTNGGPAMGGPPPMGPPMGGPPPMGPPPMGPPPTDQGVGALLGPGMSPPPPPPQMMAAVGGAVKKLQGGSTATSTGGDPDPWLLGGPDPRTPKEEISRLAELYGEDYQDIMKIMAPTEQQNRLAKSQLFFDAARAGLNLAANRDSQGNPLRGSTASKFAAVTEPVLAKIPAASKAAQSAATEAAARQAAITSAMSRRTAGETEERALERLRIQEEAAENRARIAISGKASTPPTEWTLIAPDGTKTVIDARDATARAKAEQLQALSGYTIHTGTANIPTADFSTSDARGVFANPDQDMWNRVELGKQTDDDIVIIQSAWEELTRQIPTGEIDAGGLPLYAPESDVADYYQQIINRHVEQFPDSPFKKYTTEGITTALSPVVPGPGSGVGAGREDVPVAATSGMSFDIPGISGATQAQLEAIIGEETDPSKAFLDLLDSMDAGVEEVYGLGAAVTRFMTEKGGAIIPLLQEIDPNGASEARSALEGFTTMSALAMAEAMEGREAQATLDRFHALFPSVAQVFTRPKQALGKYKFLLTEQQTAVMTGARQLADVQSKLTAGGLSRDVADELRAEERIYARSLPILALSMVKIDGIIKRLESGEAQRRGEAIREAPVGALLPGAEIEQMGADLGDMTINPNRN